MQALASKMSNEYASQSILERNVTKMQFQLSLAVYTDIVVDRIGDAMAMGAIVIVMDEVNNYLSYSDPALSKCPRVPRALLHALACLPDQRSPHTRP